MELIMIVHEAEVAFEIAVLIAYIALLLVAVVWTVYAAQG